MFLRGERYVLIVNVEEGNPHVEFFDVWIVVDSVPLALISSCQSSSHILISSLSKLGKEDKIEFKTCKRAESCQSNGLQMITNHRASHLSPAISSHPKRVTTTDQ